MYKILIIEDEKDTAKPVKEALEMDGYQADIAADGEIGVQMFEKNRYDLILLDLEMPKLNGKEALKKIRAKDAYTYVIIYTNYKEFEDVKELANLGIDGYINKGGESDLRGLINKIKEMLDPLDFAGVKRLMEGIEDIPLE